MIHFASIAERGETSGMSYFAQIPDGQRRRPIIIDTPSQGVRSSIQAESEPIRVSVASLRDKSGERKYHASTFNPSRRIAETSAARCSRGCRRNDLCVAALTPICVEKFLQNSDAKANLAVLQKISTTWEQGDYLQKGGWATRPGATSSDYQLARACAEKLVLVKIAAQ